MRVLRPLVLSLLLVLGGGITALSAQNREVSGKVLDANQQPLVGVAVLVDGTTKGVTTSENGTFKIQVPSGEAVLQVTCLGYLPQKVTVPSSRNSITIYLQEDAIMLDATVVIGYGTQKKVNLTGAVATVGSKELENRVTHSVTNMLQGSVAGLNITTSSGKPGSTPSINIRGVNSVNSADPLVLIDGVVGDLNRVNPNDVESISVIKDASANIIGNRARVKVIKNKMAPPFRVAEFDIMYNEGISKAGSVLDVATDMGILEKRGSWFSLDGEQLGQGRDQTTALIASDPELCRKISDRIMAAIKGGEAAAPLEIPDESAAPAEPSAE